MISRGLCRALAWLCGAAAWLLMGPVIVLAVIVYALDWAHDWLTRTPGRPAPWL